MLISVRQDWARVLTVEPRPLPASTAVVRGQDLLPAAGALGLAALAGLAAVVATRRLARRVVGGVLAAFGVAVIVAVSMPLTDAQVRGAVTGRGQRAAGSGGSTVRQRYHARVARVSGLEPVQPCHDGRRARGAGRCCSGALLVWPPGCWSPGVAPRWPVMSSRYDRPPARPAARRAAVCGDPAPLGIAEPGPGPDCAGPGGDPPDPPRSPLRAERRQRPRR